MGQVGLRLCSGQGCSCSQEVAWLFVAAFARGCQGRKGEEETLSSELCCCSHISQSQSLLIQGI